MDIKRYGSQRMVFKESIVNRIKWALALIFLVPIAYIFPLPINIILGVILVMYISTQVIMDSRTVIIDKANQKITVKSRDYLFIREKQVIPFSNYMNVLLYRTRLNPTTGHGTGGEYSNRLYIQVGGDRIFLDDSKNEESLRAEAYLVSSFTGWELLDTKRTGYWYSSSETTDRYDINQPREKIVDKWKQRIEQERKEWDKK